MSHSTIPTPRPPYSSGHDTTDQRASYMTRSQARWASNPSAVSSDGNAPVPVVADGAWASSQDRTSARNRSCSDVKRRSMHRESDTPPDIGQQAKGREGPCLGPGPPDVEAQE